MVPFVRYGKMFVNSISSRKMIRVPWHIIQTVSNKNFTTAAILNIRGISEQMNRFDSNIMHLCICIYSPLYKRGKISGNIRNSGRRCISKKGKTLWKCSIDLTSQFIPTFQPFPPHTYGLKLAMSAPQHIIHRWITNFEQNFKKWAP